MKKKLIICHVCITALLAFGGCANTNANISYDGSGVSSDQSSEDAGEKVEGTQASEITLKDIMEANSVDAIFSRHKSYSFEITVAQDGSDRNIKAYGMYGFTGYAEPGLKFLERDFYDEAAEDNHFRDNVLLAETGPYYSWDENGQKIYSKAWYAMSDEERAKRIIESGDSPDGGVIENGEEYGEHMVSVEDNGDGTLTITTNAPIDRNENEFSDVSDEWKGKDAEYHYIVDKDTLEVKQLDMYVLTDDGPVDYLTETITYDVEEPEGIADIRRQADYMDSGNYENPRSITVIYDQGSDKEEIFETTADKSFKVTVLVRDGYGQYGDPEGKSKDIIPDDNGNVVIYGLPEN